MIPTHRRAETTINFEDGKLVQRLGVTNLGELVVRNDLVGSRRLDTVPLSRRLYLLMVADGRR